MGAAELRVYQEAKASWEAARARVERLAIEIEEVTRALRHNPLTLMVAYVPGGTSPELRPLNTPILDGRRWPTAETLARALADLREAAFSVRSAWVALSEEERLQVEPAEGALI
ncbi:MAG: hypothetical protein HY688_02270 [Chloroflexi bacterium]|nr:hypothetical protein [Chloroflexota bacterium]